MRSSSPTSTSATRPTTTAISCVRPMRTWPKRTSALVTSTFSVRGSEPAKSWIPFLITNASPIVISRSWKLPARRARIGRQRTSSEVTASAEVASCLMRVMCFTVKA